MPVEQIILMTHFYLHGPQGMRIDVMETKGKYVIRKSFCIFEYVMYLKLLFNF